MAKKRKSPGRKPAPKPQGQGTNNSGATAQGQKNAAPAKEAPKVTIEDVKASISQEEFERKKTP